ncbi:unnamed protein product [Hydatigera taeniaeformis]|uniref:Adaptin_N domain-containing protein n=1 Tax=Hydatigena taeniaeformis TaxID=6205 RepID=A0A158RF83_HYDTA|nr:unnamed protein product [Hydatigera taeniaeformis]
MALSAVKNTLERALDKDLSDLVRGIRAHKYDEVCGEDDHFYFKAKYINECIDEIKNELKTGNIVSKANAINKLAYFGALTPLEPRLGKKLIEPLTNLIHNTSAMSLLYECINTVLAGESVFRRLHVCAHLPSCFLLVLLSISSGVPDHHASIQLCVQKLRILIEDSDQNLKYLGLLAMGKILRHHPKSVQAHKDLILTCLDDRDESIRLRALDLLHGMVSRTNLLEIVRSLVRHLSTPEIGTHFRAELIATVVRICSQGNYQYVLSFEWYISVLLELAQLNISRNGELLANQLLDVAVRVASVRPFAVSQMAIFLRSYKRMITHSNQASLHDVIYAAAWICGEYAGFLEEPRETLEAMLETANLVDLRGHIQSVLVLNSLKLYCKLAAKWFNESPNGCMLENPVLEDGDSEPSLSHLQDLLEHLLELTNFFMDKISLFVHSANLEVQERAVSIHQLLHLMTKRLSKLRAQVGDSIPNSTATTEIVDFMAAGSGERLDPLGPVASEARSSAESHQQTIPVHDLRMGLHTLLYELCSLFEGELNPVAPKAQRKVPLPEGLDLDAWINEPPSPPSQALTGSSNAFTSPQDTKSKKVKRKNVELRPTGDGIFTGLVESEGPKSVQLSQAELDEMRKQRLLMQQSNPHYLKPVKSSSHNLVVQDEESTPTLTQDDPLVEEPSNGVGSFSYGFAGLKLASSDKFAMEMQKQFREMSKANAKASGSRSKATKKERRSKQAAAVEQVEGEALNDFPTNVAVSNVMDLPEGVAPSELDSPDEENDLDPTDPHRLLNIQLDIETSEAVATNAPRKNSKVRKRKAKVEEEGGEWLGRDSTALTSSQETVNHHVQQGISEESFLKLLMSSTLTAACRVKVRCPATAEAVKRSTSTSVEDAFVALLNNLSAEAGASVVERVGATASLYAEVARTPVCVLVKLSVSSIQVLDVPTLMSNFHL